MSNITIEEENVFANVEISNATDISTWRHVYRYWSIATDLLNFFVCLTNVGANVFLIYIILRFRRLRNRTNYYLVNFAITNTIYHVFVPIFVIISEFILKLSFQYFYIYCFFYLVEESAVFSSYLFACAIAVDWYLVNYHSRFIHLHQKLYKFAIALVYLIAVVRYWIIALTACLAFTNGIVHFLYVTYMISLIIAIIVNVLKFRRKDIQDLHKTKNSLTIANIAVFSWLPLFVWYFIMYVDWSSTTISYLLRFTEIIPKLIAHLNTIVMLYALGKIDKHFAMAYGRAFKRNLRNYENDDLDRDSEDEAVVEHQVSVVPEPIDSEAANILAY